MSALAAGAAESWQQALLPLGSSCSMLLHCGRGLVLSVSNMVAALGFSLGSYDGQHAAL